MWEKNEYAAGSGILESVDFLFGTVSLGLCLKMCDFTKVAVCELRKSTDRDAGS